MSGDSDAAAQLTELARAEGLEVKVRKKKVDYYYVSKPGKSIGMSGGKGIRFWCQDGERLQVANSQFSLWNVRKDEQDAKLLEMPASTVGYVYLDLTGGTKFLPLATMAFASLSGSNLPELGPIAERLGEARVFIRREGPELVAEGTSDLPLGFALHLLFGGYSSVDGTKTER
ncbi:MAG: hypothetical protein U5N86_03705 [Planctomycetota bacterium]|nr:hypothetical protein [Planctomycetota bacterium]